MDSSQKVGRELIVTRGDTPEVFQSPEHALDSIACTIQHRTEGRHEAAVSFWLDVRRRAAVAYGRPHSIGIVTAVCKQQNPLWHSTKQHLSGAAAGGLPAPQGKGSRAAYVETSAAGVRVRAYVPAPLPPSPPLDLGRFIYEYERAIAAVGGLDGVTMILPSRPLLLYIYVRKEALFSSKIEGTQSSPSDLLLFENHETPSAGLDDVTEVSNYIAAIEHGVSRMRGGFPVSLRLIREMHAILGVSLPTARIALNNLIKVDIVCETTGRQRGRIYAYADYLALLESRDRSVTEMTLLPRLAD